jgi:hypothetical protein
LAGALLFTRRPTGVVFHFERSELIHLAA